MFNDKFLLTQAVLRGEKTQTRRIAKDGTPLGNFEETLKHSPYKVGEVVAVAQCYKRIYAEMIIDFAKHNYHLPREDAAEMFRKQYENTAGWDNKMYVKAELMPHHIRILDVRLERLQSISEEDALKEGIYELAFDYYLPYRCENPFNMPRKAFAVLIDKVSGKGTWDSNPYVWVYDFELVK